jgi:hypothetical protein
VVKLSCAVGCRRRLKVTCGRDRSSETVEARIFQEAFPILTAGDMARALGFYS